MSRIYLAQFVVYKVKIIVDRASRVKLLLLDYYYWPIEKKMQMLLVFLYGLRFAISELWMDNRKKKRQVIFGRLRFFFFMALAPNVSCRHVDTAQQRLGGVQHVRQRPEENVDGRVQRVGRPVVRQVFQLGQQ